MKTIILTIAIAAMSFAQTPVPAPATPAAPAAPAKVAKKSAKKVKKADATKANAAKPTAAVTPVAK